MHGGHIHPLYYPRSAQGFKCRQPRRDIRSTEALACGDQGRRNAGEPPCASTWWPRGCSSVFPSPSWRTPLRAGGRGAAVEKLIPLKICLNRSKRTVCCVLAIPGAGRWERRRAGAAFGQRLVVKADGFVLGWPARSVLQHSPAAVAYRAARLQQLGRAPWQGSRENTKHVHTHSHTHAPARNIIFGPC